MTFQFKEIFTDLYVNSGFSKTKLASLIGINHSLITLYLDGTIPTTKTMQKICKYFNCSMDYMMGLNDKSTYSTLKHVIIRECFYPEYKRLLEINKTNHFQLSKQGLVCESSLSSWKYGHIPQFENIYKIAKELGGSIDKLLGRI